MHKVYTINKVRHEQYMDVLNHWKRRSCDFRAFRSKRHRVVTSTKSVCRDKRFLLKDSIHSLAYGHYAVTAGDTPLGYSTAATTVPREGGKEMGV